MIWLLGFICGAATIAAMWVAADWRSTKRAHEEYLREWQRAHNGWAIIRTRHRRAGRHGKAPPLPMDLVGYQVEKYGRSRIKRIGGVWK